MGRHLPGAKHVANGAPMPHTSPFDANQTGGGFGVSVTPFHARSTVRASHVVPAIAPRPEQISAPKVGARTPMHVERQRKTNVKTAVGKNDRTTQPRAGLELNHEAAADAYLSEKFPAPLGLGDAGLAAFTREQSALLRNIRAAIPVADRGQPAFAKERFVGHALAEACGGDVDRATAALDLLRDPMRPGTLQQQRDVLSMRCILSRSRASFTALRHIEGAPPIHPALPAPTALQEKVHQDADWQNHRAAAILLDAWPVGIERPSTLDELAAAANAALPPAERALDVAVAAHPDQRVISEALGAHTQAAKAMLCARALLADRGAQPETRFRSAYFAQRNGIAESELAQVQNRMFSLVKHANRNATSTRTQNWFKRTAEGFGNGIRHGFGYHKNPLATLSMGTAGGMLDHPEKDFSTLQAIDVVADRLNDILVHERPGTVDGRPPDPDTMQTALRASALHHWKAGIGVKGWLRDDTKFGRFQRRRIASDAARALNTDSKTIRNSDAFKNLPTMNAATLRAWAREAGADMAAPVGGVGGKTLEENLDRMQAIRQDPIEKPGTPAGNIDSLCHLIDNIPKTWSVQMSSGGVYGLDANISENFATALGVVGAPSASVAPDVRYLKGRHALIEVGSTSHHGEMFIGTDNRRSAHVGIGGFIGWSLAGGKLMVSNYNSLIAGRDVGKPRGVAIRAAFNQTEHPGDVDAWRNKMTQAVHTLGESGAGGGMPQTKEEMWNGMAHAFFADPDLSIGWVDNRSRTHYGALSTTLGVRYVSPANVKIGPMLSAEAVVASSKAHSTDKSGSRTADKSSSGFRMAVNASATVVASPPPAPFTSPTAINSLSFSSAPLVGVGTTILQTGVGATLRLYEENGEIVPERSYQDMEFTSVGAYKQYMDSRNTEWVRSMGGSQADLSNYLSKVKLNATRANQLHGERLRMRPEAAAEINAYRGALRMFERNQAPNEAEVQEMHRISGHIAALLQAPGSWTNHVLYSYETNASQSSNGLSYVFSAQSVNQVSAQRELSALAAIA